MDFSEADWNRLQTRLTRLEAQVARMSGKVNATALTATQTLASSPKRFRIGVFTTPLTVVGSPVVGSVKWSSPIKNAAGDPVDAYNVDAACSAMPNTQWPFITSGMSSAGVTIQFNAPTLLALGSIVVVLAVSPAS